MVKLFGKSLLEWQLETYRSCDITDISVVKGYCSEKINFPNINYYYNKKFETTNMVETLFCAKEKLIDSFHDLKDLDIGLDEKISYSALSNQAVHRVWPMIVNKGNYTLLDINTINN